MEIGVEHAGHFGSEELSEGHTRDASHDLTNQKSLGHEVVARRRAGLPQRRLSGERIRATLPIGEVPRLQRCAPEGKSRGVTHHVANLDVLFPVLRELGPVLHHRRVKVELTSVGQHQRHEKRHGLGHRPHIHDGVALPRCGHRFVRETTPQIHDELTFGIDRERSTNFLATAQLPFEHVTKTVEFFGRGALHDRHCPSRLLHPISQKTIANRTARRCATSKWHSWRDPRQSIPSLISIPRTSAWRAL